LIDILNDLKKRILYREDSINQLQYDLDDTEVRKSALISTELKTLVDKRIAQQSKVKNTATGKLNSVPEKPLVLKH
jgi:hypothetical protein